MQQIETFNTHRIVETFAIMGEHIDVSDSSPGYWHGKAYIVQTVTDAGPGGWKEWGMVAAFVHIRDAVAYVRAHD